MTQEQREALDQYIEDLRFDISLLAQSGMSPAEQELYFEKERRRALDLIMDRDTEPSASSRHADPSAAQHEISDTRARWA